MCKGEGPGDEDASCEADMYNQLEGRLEAHEDFLSIQAEVYNAKGKPGPLRLQHRWQPICQPWRLVFLLSSG